MESRALNESLFAHMHFYVVINSEQSTHCLVWHSWANNEWSSNAPQTGAASERSIHGHRGRGRVWVFGVGGVSFDKRHRAGKPILLCITSLFFKVAGGAIVAMSKIWSDQYLWVCLIKERAGIQVLTKGLGHTSVGLQRVYTGIWCWNSGSVLGRRLKWSSDPCPCLVSQQITLLVHSGRTWKRDLGLGNRMRFIFFLPFIMFYYVQHGIWRVTADIKLRQGFWADWK